MKYFRILPIIVLSFLFACCSSSENADKEVKHLTGKVFMTGNEPFTSIALIVDQNTTYILDGKEEVIKMLKSHQGEYADVTFTAMHDVPGGKALEVTDAVLTKPEIKK